MKNELTVRKTVKISANASKVWDAITNPKAPSKTLKNALRDYNTFVSKVKI